MRLRGTSSSDEEVEVEGVGDGRRREDEENVGRTGGRLVDEFVVEDFLPGDRERFPSLTLVPNFRAFISLCI